LERLLRDPEELALDARIRLARAVHGELDRRRVDAAQDVDVLLQRRDEPVGLEVGRPQLEHERAHLLACLRRQPPHLGQLGTGRLRVAVEQLGRRLGGEREREERLGDGVVAIATAA
jgi:hypothetical protein